MDQTRRRFVAQLTAAAALLPSRLGAQPTKPSPSTVRVGAAAPGGVYNVWGGGFSRLLGEALGVQASVETTGGPVANVQLLEGRKLEFGMVTAGPAFEGWHGLGWAKGKKHQAIRTAFPMYTTYFQMYALKKTGIRSIYDLNGKRVGVGPVGGTPATYWPLLFEITGIKPATVVNGSATELHKQIKDGRLDASGQSLGIPWPTIVEAEATDQLDVFGVPREAAAEFIVKYPYFAAGAIPAGTYRSASQPVPTLTLWNFMATHTNVPDDLIYRVVKATFERTEVLVAAHSSARELKIDNVAHSPIPLHNGAVRFYRERGVKLPDTLLGGK